MWKYKTKKTRKLDPALCIGCEMQECGQNDNQQKTNNTLCTSHFACRIQKYKTRKENLETRFHAPHWLQKAQMWAK
jgi:hypothetical protein